MKNTTRGAVDSNTTTHKRGGGDLARCRYCKRVVEGMGLAVPGLDFAHTACSLKHKQTRNDCFTGKVVRTGGARRDPETIIQEVGAVELSKTAAGRTVLNNARAKYRIELLQPHDSEFKKYWGKDVERRERDMAEVRAESQRLKAEKGMV